MRKNIDNKGANISTFPVHYSQVFHKCDDGDDSGEEAASSKGRNEKKR